jgi:hypothetical protein
MLILLLLALADPHDARLAKTYYLQFCAECHGTAGRGDTLSARAFPAATLDLTRIAERHGRFDPRAIAEVIAGPEIEHRSAREMPRWRDVLSPAKEASESSRSIARHRIQLIADYVASLQVPTSTTSPPPNRR